MKNTLIQDFARAKAELASWISRGHSPLHCVELFPVATGYELAVIDCALNGQHWLIGDQTPATQAEALYQLGAVLDELKASQQSSNHQANQ
jgi:hypothetical protein